MKHLRFLLKKNEHPIISFDQNQGIIYLFSTFNPFAIKSSSLGCMVIREVIQRRMWNIK
jgi:hypothetical protein